MMKKCPRCGSKRVAPILYGLPMYDEEMVRKLRNEELFLGGCCVSQCDPQFHCFECGKDVGSPPIIIRNGREEDYRDCVTEIRFSDGGYFTGFPEVSMKKKHGAFEIDVLPGFGDLEGGLHREMTYEEWKKVLDRLYCKLYLHEWKKSFCDPHIMDGEQWELSIKLTEGRKRRYSGSNAFPPYWRELRSVFRPFFKEAGISF